MRSNLRRISLILAGLVVLPMQSLFAASNNVSPYTTTTSGTITQTVKDSVNADSLTLSVNDNYNIGFKSFDSSLGTLNSITFTMPTAVVGGVISVSQGVGSTDISYIFACATVTSDIFGEDNAFISNGPQLTTSPTLPRRFSTYSTQNLTFNQTSLVSPLSPVTQTFNNVSQLNSFISK